MFKNLIIVALVLALLTSIGYVSCNDFSKNSLKQDEIEKINMEWTIFVQELENQKEDKQIQTKKLILSIIKKIKSKELGL